MRIERFEWDGRDAPALAARLRRLSPPLSEVTEAVSEILGAVRERGDEAVRELAERFGEAAPESLQVDPEAVEAAPGLLEPWVREALRVAARNIEVVARAELERAARPVAAELEAGQRVEVRSEPVPYAGVYAPGGKAAYPSSLLMCCVPARVAGVARIVVASPPAAGSGRPSTPVLAACAIAGVSEVFAIGGAQAIAAFAYGTESVPRVDVIAGPGNRYVTEAKRIVAGQVGIDGVAGPSELAIVADAAADPGPLALDLCAQAEHGDDSALLAVSPDAALLDRIEELVEELAAQRPTVADASLALVSAPGVQTALELSDAFAPEHLQLAFAGADETVARARLAGCVFLGPGGATAFGDYAAGSNHVLPTGGAARYGGPVGPGTFMRRTSVVTVSERAARALAPTVETLAQAEGFPVHGESAVARSGAAARTTPASDPVEGESPTAAASGDNEARP
jgi:histidinol dehydrogenase